MWRVLSWGLIAAGGLVIVGILVFDSPKDNAMYWGLLAMALAFAGVGAAKRARSGREFDS